MANKKKSFKTPGAEARWGIGSEKGRASAALGKMLRRITKKKK